MDIILCVSHSTNGFFHSIFLISKHVVTYTSGWFVFTAAWHFIVWLHRLLILILQTFQHFQFLIITNNFQRSSLCWKAQSSCESLVSLLYCYTTTQDTSLLVTKCVWGVGFPHQAILSTPAGYPTIEFYSDYLPGNSVRSAVKSSVKGLDEKAMDEEEAEVVGIELSLAGWIGSNRGWGGGAVGRDSMCHHDLEAWLSVIKLSATGDQYWRVLFLKL